jgi:hypothetical protein
VVYYFNFLFPLFVLGIVQIVVFVVALCRLAVGMSIPEEPAAFAFGVERLGTSLSLMQAYMVSQPIQPYSEHLSFWSGHSAVSG